MQKNNIKAYILIWSIFISMIISITFISINTKINKNLNNNKDIINNYLYNIDSQNTIKESFINNDFSEKNIWNWETIIFENSKENIFSLKEKDKHLSKINTLSVIQISILIWWPIYFKNNSMSWIVNNSSIISMSTWNLLIKNLWWYTKIKITSDKSGNYLTQFLNYKILKKIWNNELIKNKWKIKNF